MNINSNNFILKPKNDYVFKKTLVMKEIRIY